MGWEVESSRTSTVGNINEGAGAVPPSAANSQSSAVAEPERGVLTWTASRPSI